MTVPHRPRGARTPRGNGPADGRGTTVPSPPPHAGRYPEEGSALQRSPAGGSSPLFRSSHSPSPVPIRCGRGPRATVRPARPPPLPTGGPVGGVIEDDATGLAVLGEDLRAGDAAEEAVGVKRAEEYRSSTLSRVGERTPAPASKECVQLTPALTALRKNQLNNCALFLDGPLKKSITDGVLESGVWAARRDDRRNSCSKQWLAIADSSRKRCSD